MINFTKEQLIQKLKHRISVASGFPDSEKAKMDLELARIALASLEAEPMAFIGQRMLEELTDGSRSCGRVWSEVTDKLSDENRIPLYTAPPAPVSVPDEATPENIEILASTYAPSGITYQWDIDECNAATDSWNACCCAMLQGAEPVSNLDELPDGWVACSERMPEDEKEVITHNIFGYRHVSFFDEHSGHFFDRLDGSPVDCVEHVLVSHWMPLPAAPQQEVK